MVNRAVGVLPSAERYFYFLGASFFRSTSEKSGARWANKKGEYQSERRLKSVLSQQLRNS
jgi:hypothetical protein